MVLRYTENDNLEIFQFSQTLKKVSFCSFFLNPKGQNEFQQFCKR